MNKKRKLCPVSLYIVCLFFVRPPSQYIYFGGIRKTKYCSNIYSLNVVRNIQLNAFCYIELKRAKKSRKVFFFFQFFLTKCCNRFSILGPIIYWCYLFRINIQPNWIEMFGVDLYGQICLWTRAHNDGMIKVKQFKCKE